MDGPSVLHEQSSGDAPGAFRGDGLHGAGGRHEDDGEHSGHHHGAPSRPADPAPAARPAAGPAPAAQPAGGAEPAADAPRIEIGTALGPVAGGSGGVSARAAVSAGRAAAAASRRPLLSVDAPSPFAPRRIAGELRDAPGAVAVQVAIRRGTPARGCSWWSARAARFTATRRSDCQATRWITGRVLAGPHGGRWRVDLGGPLPGGSYRYLVRVVDAAGRPVAFDRV